MVKFIRDLPTFKSLDLTINEKKKAEEALFPFTERSSKILLALSQSNILFFHSFYFFRGTSRSPPEAWDTRSEPDTRSTKESEPDDWRNVTNTSYNLLDLDPFYNGDIESASPPQPGGTFFCTNFQFFQLLYRTSVGQYESSLFRILH